MNADTVAYLRLEAMMKAAFRHEFDAILIVRLDRIMRSIANFVVLNDELNAAKVGLVCTDQLIDTATPSGRLQQNIFIAFMEYEREIVREMGEGRDRSSEIGGQAARSTPGRGREDFRADLTSAEDSGQ